MRRSEARKQGGREKEGKRRAGEKTRRDKELTADDEGKNGLRRRYQGRIERKRIVSS